MQPFIPRQPVGLLVTVHLLAGALAALAVITAYADGPRAHDIGIGVAWAGLGTVLLLLGFAWLGASRVLYPRLIARTESPEQFNLPAEPVTFPSRDSTVLRGLFIPGDKPSTIIMLHGYRQNKRSMLSRAAFLHQASYSLLLFDLRRHGESGGSVSTFGALEQFDLLGAIDYLKGRPDVDPSGLGILGISLGAVTAILTAAISLDIQAVVAESSFQSIESSIDQGFRRYVRLPRVPFVPLIRWVVEQRAGIQVREVDAERAIAHLSPRPVLLVHGTRDPLVDPSNSQALYAAAGEPKELWLVHGGGHADALKVLPEEYQRRVLAFFRKYLP